MDMIVLMFLKYFFSNSLCFYYATVLLNSFYLYNIFNQCIKNIWFYEQIKRKTGLQVLNTSLGRTIYQTNHLTQFG